MWLENAELQKQVNVLSCYIVQIESNEIKSGLCIQTKQLTVENPVNRV